MTSQHNKAKRWRPKFSVRTLVIVVTLLCCYAACWGPTKESGVEDVQQLVNKPDGYVFGVELKMRPFIVGYEPSAALPLVVGIYCQDFGNNVFSRRYYFWFFGYVAKLPLERKVDVIPIIPLDSPRGTGKQVMP